MEYKTCSFTGHRKINEKHKDKISELVARAIKYAYDKGCRNFLTGGALGFDTIAAKEIIKFRMHNTDVKLILVLPCLNQGEHWCERERAMYDYIMSSADETVYVSEIYYDGCMKDRNFRLAESCDILIAYVGKSRSGSAQTVRIAEKMGKEIYNLYPALSKMQ